MQNTKIFEVKVMVVKFGVYRKSGSFFLIFNIIFMLTGSIFLVLFSFAYITIITLFTINFVDQIGIFRKIFFSFLNQQNSCVEFTFEVEQNNTLNFLDTTIFGKYGKLTFKHYQKSYQRNRIINNFSFQPFSYKFNIAYNLLNRMISITLVTTTSMKSTTNLK